MNRSHEPDKAGKTQRNNQHDINWHDREATRQSKRYTTRPMIRRWPNTDEARELREIARSFVASADSLREQLNASLKRFAKVSPQTDLSPRVREAAEIFFPYFLRSMAAATKLLSIEEYFAAGAVARKALEIMYALRIIARKGDDGVQLVEIVGTRNVAGVHRKAIESIRKSKNSEYHGVDLNAAAQHAREHLRKIKKVVPNGDMSRVEARDLADWAELLSFHDRVYANLNVSAHFDAVEALELASEKSGGPLIQASVARRYLDVARACAEIMAWVLGTGEGFGDAAASPVLKTLSERVSGILCEGHTMMLPRSMYATQEEDAGRHAGH